MTDAQPAVTESAAEPDGELAFLRQRVAELDGELLEQARRTNAAIAAAQERAYWLDRWHVDLNALMERPVADRVRTLARTLRAPVRRVRLVSRSLRG